MKLNNTAYVSFILLLSLALYATMQMDGLPSAHSLSDAVFSLVLLGCAVALLVWRSAIIDSLVDSRVAVVKILSDEEMSARRIRVIRVIYSIGIIFASVLFLFAAYATYFD